MDIFAHDLWAGVGLALARRRWPIAPRTVAATLAATRHRQHPSAHA